jgi:hypothetical protein
VVTDFLVPKLCTAAANPRDESMSNWFLIMPSISILISSILTLEFEILLTLPLVVFPLADATEDLFSFKLDAFCWLEYPVYLFD